MTIERLRRTKVAAAIGAAAFGLTAGNAMGAAFALQESSASGLGNAYAGGAARVDDAGTVWSNPAGMSKLDRMSIVLGIGIITPSIKFHDDGSLPAAFQPLGNTGGDAGDTNFVPNAYFVVPINKQFSFGVGVTAPFGLKTEYNSDWLGRFQGVKSEVKTINVNPAISWKATDNIAIGLGVDWQRIDATFTSQINYSAGLGQAAQTAAQQGLIPAALVPVIVGATPGLEASTNVNGDDSAWGWNIGVLFDLSPATQVGFAYRSSLKYHIDGNVSFGTPALPVLPPALAPVVGQLAGAVNAQLANGGVKSNIELPDIVNASIFHRFDSRWDLMADIQWTRWSTIQDLTFTRTTGSVLQSTPENFDDAWRVSVGANYRYNDSWLFRGGLAWDQTPVNTTDRTVRLPDEDRYWFSLGAQYRINNNMRIDGGFTYIVANKADINQNAGSTAANGLVKGNYDANVTIFGVQLDYAF